MTFFSRLLRFLFFTYNDVGCFLRVVKLKLLYPGISIDFNTKIARGCSIVCVKGSTIKISGSHIYFGTQILADNNAAILIEDAFIGRNCCIVAHQEIIIKKGCLIAEMVVIRDQNHLVDMEKENAREFFDKAPVCIEENAWLASKSTVLKGVTVGKNAVLAASAVADKNIPAGEVWGGIPARFIKQVKIQ